MLPTTNREIEVKTLSTDADTGKRTFEVIETGLPVYINPNGEEIVEGFNGEGSFLAHKMMTDGEHAKLSIGDRVTDDQGNQYDIRGKAEYDDITGKHNQYLLVETYE